MSMTMTESFDDSFCYHELQNAHGWAVSNYGSLAGSVSTVLVAADPAL